MQEPPWKPQPMSSPWLQWLLYLFILFSAWLGGPWLEEDHALPGHYFDKAISHQEIVSNQEIVLPTGQLSGDSLSLRLSSQTSLGCVKLTKASVTPWKNKLKNTGKKGILQGPA